jgi:hypothetical protein
MHASSRAKKTGQSVSNQRNSFHCTSLYMKREPIPGQGIHPRHQNFGSSRNSIQRLQLVLHEGSRTAWSLILSDILRLLGSLGLEALYVSEPQ